MMKGKIIAVCVSSEKGTRKKNIGKSILVENSGLLNDAHRGDPIRQVSLLAWESIEKMRKKGLDVKEGDFAENLTTKGIDLLSLPIGTRVKAGETILEVTQIGKVCHTRCSIYYQAGDCVMPKEGIFTKVIKGGKVEINDNIEEVTLSKSL